ncbi:hypothetical protein C4J81_00390 [Deltaproteobacteria bacterium Smac51]|nr:hypothetical protein C4J81_00310 [Deltaproteobacteria bacterium Smac51]UQZ87756.1 hypothetical protein C4J81_00390 [Deltaproteobacteria bacterium Smac51]
MLTLRTFFNDFLTDARIRLSATSVVRYKRSFKALMYDLGDFFPVECLTNKQLNKWAYSLLQKGRSPEGINLDLRHIRAALRRGEDLGVIAIAPKVDMVRTPKRLPRHLTMEQFNRIVAAERNELFRRLWIFMVWTGVRRYEAHGLEWECVTLGDNPRMQVVGKGDRERVVPILAPALEAMGRPEVSGRVFEVGSLDNMTAHFKATAKAAGLPKARLHDLRHTCLTLLVGHGVPLKLVQDIAGHSTITTTMNYAKLFTGNAHSILNKALGFEKMSKSLVDE